MHQSPLNASSKHHITPSQSESLGAGPVIHTFNKLQRTVSLTPWGASHPRPAKFEFLGGEQGLNHQMSPERAKGSQPLAFFPLPDPGGDCVRVFLYAQVRCCGDRIGRCGHFWCTDGPQFTMVQINNFSVYIGANVNRKTFWESFQNFGLIQG